MANAGRVLTRESLLDNLYDDYRIVTDRTVDSHIKNLRRKLERWMPSEFLFAPFMDWDTVLKGSLLLSIWKTTMESAA